MCCHCSVQRFIGWTSYRAFSLMVCACMQNPGAQDKAQVKTATAVAGVQEDLKGLRDRLTASQVGFHPCTIAVLDQSLLECNLKGSKAICTMRCAEGIMLLLFTECPHIPLRGLAANRLRSVEKIYLLQASAEGEAKPGMGEQIKGFGVKVIDHAQAALEGAKQKVTKQTTQPASTAPES